MPFGLKNVGATYQRMVNHMVASLIRKNMEVYMDNMLIKSTKANQHEANLEEAFQILLNLG